MKKFKYMVEFLGLVDHYGNPIRPTRYTNWLVENCNGKWYYYSPDAPMPNWGYGFAPEDWPIFYKIQFYFQYKKDLNQFRKQFIDK